MGLLSWIKGAGDSSPVAPSRARLTFTIGDDGGGLVKLTGTTTYSKDSIAALLRRRGAGEKGYFEEDAVLVREPENRADPHAVAVHVDGERVGYLPSYLTKTIPVSDQGALTAPVQIFSITTASGVRAEAFAWLGEGRPQWEFTETNRPPLTPEEKRTADHQRTTKMVDDALAGGGERAKQFQAGMVNGIHYLQTVEPIKQLKRDGRLQDALELCHLAITAAEGDLLGGVPAPWYTEQAAIIHRKLGQHEQEIAVLQRWLAYLPEQQRADNNLGRRLAKISS